MTINWSGVIAGLIIILFIFDGVQTIRLDYSKKDVDAYKLQLQTLEAASKMQQERFNAAQVAAASDMQVAQNMVDKLVRTKVSSNCDKAMAWGLSQAKR